MATTAQPVYDLRDDIFAAIGDSIFRAVVTAQREGVLAGSKFAREQAEALGVTLEFHLNDGDLLTPGARVLTASGTPKALAMAEERLLGCLCKASGIATASRKAAELAEGRVKIVSGAWKKMDPALKWPVRMAIASGGLDSRIVDGAFLYLDKNYVRMLGGVAATLRAVEGLEGVRVIQLKGETAHIAEEVQIACEQGAGIVMVDTGYLPDAEVAVALVRSRYPGVKVAFAGGVKIADIPALTGRGIDILDIGAEIVDAPLIDMKIDVVGPATLEYNLLEKTELWIDNITMQNVNLTDVACAVAEVLHLDRSEVLVVDVRETHLTLDVLRRTIRAEDVVGKRDQLLRRLAEIPGLLLSEETEVHSDGILGMIAVSPEYAGEMLRASEALGEQIKAAVAKRVLVFSSGFEVKRGMIEDTNSPFLKAHLEQRGFDVTIGPILDDDEETIARALRNALDDGYGLVVTTGGVGAEDKDRTVEALLRVDPQAATPYLVRYEAGKGRHVKEGVRIGVGQVGLTTVVNLPGPNDEVRAGFSVLIRHLTNGGLDKHALAGDLARELREILTRKMQTWHHPHGAGHQHHK